MNNALTQSALAGGICSVFGTALALAFMWRTKGEGYLSFCLLVSLASFGVMASLWWVFVARTSPPSVWRGALTGVVGVLLIHYATFYLLMVKEYAMFQITGTALTDGPQVNPLQAILPVFAVTLLSYLLLGWFTVPAGALAGALYARILRFFVAV